jgi:hypothetical protein
LDRHAQSFFGGNNSYLLATAVNNPHFWSCDLFVDAQFLANLSTSLGIRA